MKPQTYSVIKFCVVAILTSFTKSGILHYAGLKYDIFVDPFNVKTFTIDLALLIVLFVMYSIIVGIAFGKVANKN